MTPRPCTDRIHEVRADFERQVVICRWCLLEVPMTASHSRQDLHHAFQTAERDWYIKELES